MKHIFSIILLVFWFVSTAEAQSDFDKKVNIDSIRYMSLQHNQTIKTFDTYARDLLFHISGKSSRDGKPAAVVVLDMILDPQPKMDQNLIYIRNKPFRQDFAEALNLKPTDKERIIKEGTISLNYFLNHDVQVAMDKMAGNSTIKARAIRDIQDQANSLAQILDFPRFRGTFFYQAIIPPTDSATANQKPWMTLPEASVKVINAGQAPSAEYLKQLEQMVTAMQGLGKAWNEKNSDAVKTHADSLGKIAGEIDPEIYPSVTKRHFEVMYNSLSRLTWPGAGLYFVGFVFFLISWNTRTSWMYVTAWIVTLAALLVHISAIAIRWWLVQKNVDSWLQAIPIKNQFESVMFSAFFGTVVSLILEKGTINWLAKKLFKLEFVKLHGHGIFGAAGAGIGMLSLIALFAVPYVTGHDNIGAGIRQNAGILMTYWLYIHVTLVTASYALIGMTFIIGVWYCIQYFANSDAAILKTLDTANLTMLQLAFWVLGVGIITGALWADVSWGRPWGWDPKETFALITWIVYLIIVHVRFVTAGEKRSLITSILSVVGFFIMLFNWIGVNFYLVGLHSYA